MQLDPKEIEKWWSELSIIDKTVIYNNAMNYDLVPKPPTTNLTIFHKTALYSVSKILK